MNKKFLKNRGNVLVLQSSWWTQLRKMFLWNHRKRDWLRVLF